MTQPPAAKSALRLASALAVDREPPSREPRAGLSLASDPDDLVLATVARTVSEVRALVKPRRQAGAVIGLVPTMGALHQGHLSLIEEARGRCDLVVVSIFVNPTQFNEQSDLLAYPRQEERDVLLASEAGADVVFVPEPGEIYRPGFSTFVEVQGLTDRLEGVVRGASHFRGVTTVVCKLLNIVTPDLAFFGQKDAQQAAVVKRMCDDLNLDVTIETLPIVREPDGLAMSSRNVRLDASERARSLALICALRKAEALTGGGESSAERILAACAEELRGWSVEPEYVALVDPVSFEDVETLELDSEALLLVAARFGETRLIDNTTLRRGPHAGVKPDGHTERSSTPAPRRRRRRKNKEAIAACSA